MSFIDSFISFGIYSVFSLILSIIGCLNAFTFIYDSVVPVSSPVESVDFTEIVGEQYLYLVATSAPDIVTSRLAT